MADAATYGCLGWIMGLAAAETLYIGWGTGTGTAQPSDEDLFAEASEARVLAVVTLESTVRTNDTLVASGTLTCDETPKTIREVGLLTADVDGTLLLHSNFSARDLDADDWIAFVMKLIAN